MLDPVLGVLIGACVALLFASAALHKLRDPARFREIVRAYRALPAGAERLAPLVPLTELAVAAGLLVAPLRPLAASLGVLVLLGYAAAIAVNLARGRGDLDCGCGAGPAARPIAPWMIGRNLILALLLMVTLAPWQLRPFAATDAVTVGAGLAVATLLYASLDRLLGRLAPRTALLRGPR
ncbi:MAG TPA: MauE/DoxX family redox-associated membrane protein [Steroidobacteraceae bacterium]|nr:MauE/DoxX family redox-associated membrane protein [Steroidobacteraceae bacterium]